MKVSFVIPTYNCAAWINHAVQSVFEQTQPDCDLVVVNDASTDSTKDYLDWLAKQKTAVPVQILDCKENGGRSKARNLGNNLALGDIICVLDADDYAHPDRAKKTVEKMRRGFQFIHGSAEAMDFSGTKLPPSAMDLTAHEFDLKKALEEKTNRIVHSSVAYTKEIAKRFPYSSDKELSDLGLDDWEFVLRLASEGVRMGVVLAPIVAYRVLNSSVSAQRDMEKVLAVKKKWIEKLTVCA